MRLLCRFAPGSGICCSAPNICSALPFISIIAAPRRCLRAWHRALASVAPFGNDVLRVAAVTATAIIDRLRIVAEADDCALANRPDLNWRHGSTCSGSNCQPTAGASPRTDKRSLRRDARRQAGQVRQDDATYRMIG